MSALRKIISGGQTGVDQAALRAAKDCGLETGGWCPPGRECEAGIIPAEFPLKETPQDRNTDAPDIPRSQRTEWNVRDSDGTLVLRPAGKEDAGTEWTIECAQRDGRPLLLCDLDDPSAKERIWQWLATNPITTLNIAGPSESSAPGIGAKAYDLLRSVLANL
jgi:hypothetical protein